MKGPHSIHSNKRIEMLNTVKINRLSYHDRVKHDRKFFPHNTNKLLQLKSKPLPPTKVINVILKKKTSEKDNIKNNKIKTKKFTSILHKPNKKRELTINKVTFEGQLFIFLYPISFSQKIIFYLFLCPLSYFVQSDPAMMQKKLMKCVSTSIRKDKKVLDVKLTGVRDMFNKFDSDHSGDLGQSLLLLYLFIFLPIL